MMRLKSLEMSNIRSVEQLTIEVNPDGTTALFGPSGVGKSGILDALPWCLWGDTGTAGSSAAMRREGSTGAAHVTATLLVGDDTVVATRRITRSDSGTETASAKLWINNEKQSNVTPASLTRIITELTGLTAKTFRGAFYMAQGQLTDLMTGTPAKVQETFEELTGLDDLSKRIQMLREQNKEAVVRADALPGDPADVDRTAGDAAEAVKESDRLQQEANTSARTAAEGRIEWEATRDRARDLQQAERAARASREAVVGAEALVSDANKNLIAAQQHISDFGGDHDSNPHQHMAETQDRCSNLEQSVSDLTRHGAELKSAVAQAITSRAKAEQARAAHQSVDPAALASAVETAEAAVLQARTAYEEAQRTATIADATVAQRTDAITTLTRAADAACCPTCQHTLDDVTALTTDLTSQLTTAQEVAREAHTLTSVTHQDVLTTESELRAARAELAKVDGLARVAQHAAETATVAAQELEHSAATLAGLVAGVTGHDPGSDPDAIRTAALAAHETLTASVDAARSQNTAWKLLADMRLRHNNAVELAQKARAAVLSAPDADVVASAEAAERAARFALDELQSVASEKAAEAQAARATSMQLEGIADDAAARWEIKRAAADTAEETRIARDIVVGLRRDLLAEYCETISTSATEILMRLGGEHIGFTIDEAFTPQVVLPDGTTRGTRQLSGGEKARAAVCAFIGISRQLSGGGKPGMIFADEITASQDEAFRREMLTMLRSLEMPMIVVSHTADVLDVATHVIRLQRPPLGATQIAA